MVILVYLHLHRNPAFPLDINRRKKVSTWSNDELYKLFYEFHQIIINNKFHKTLILIIRHIAGVERFSTSPTDSVGHWMWHTGFMYRTYAYVKPAVRSATQQHCHSTRPTTVSVQSMNVERTTTSIMSNQSNYLLWNTPTLSAENNRW